MERAVRIRHGITAYVFAQRKPSMDVHGKIAEGGVYPYGGNDTPK